MMRAKRRLGAYRIWPSIRTGGALAVSGVFIKQNRRCRIELCCHLRTASPFLPVRRRVVRRQTMAAVRTTKAKMGRSIWTGNACAATLRSPRWKILRGLFPK